MPSPRAVMAGGISIPQLFKSSADGLTAVKYIVIPIPDDGSSDVDVVEVKVHQIQKGYKHILEENVKNALLFVSIMVFVTCVILLVMSRELSGAGGGETTANVTSPSVSTLSAMIVTNHLKSKDSL